MSRRLGIGVAGAGSIGIRGALQHLCLDDVQDKCWLAAVCDPVPGRAAAAAEKYGVARAYESYEDLLADETVDVVTLGSPIGLHFEQGLAAVKAGKHVHFNKTMTTTCAEATALIDAAASAGVKLTACPGQMLRPENRKIRELIRDGALGRLAWAATGAGFGNYHENERLRTGDDVLTTVNPSWYWRKPGGGPMYDMTVYGLHSLTGVLGPAKRVTGMSGTALREREYRGQVYQCDAEDNTFLVLDFGDTVFAYVYGALCGGLVPFGMPAYFGTKGQIIGTQFNGQPIDFGPLEGNHALPHNLGRHRELDEGHVFEDIMQLVQLVREGTPTPSTAEHARHVIEIIEAGYTAAVTGQTQELTTSFELI
jgi:predicted dehydrogenase